MLALAGIEQRGITMGTWFWPNIQLAPLFCVLGPAKRPATLKAWSALQTSHSQPHIDLQSSPFPNLVPCPECELPAEVTDWFSLRSTDGPVDHVALGCIDGHHFRMALDRLPANVIAQLRAYQGANSPARDRVLPREPGAGG